MYIRSFIRAKYESIIRYHARVSTEYILHDQINQYFLYCSTETTDDRVQVQYSIVQYSTYTVLYCSI